MSGVEAVRITWQVSRYVYSVQKRTPRGSGDMNEEPSGVTRLETTVTVGQHSEQQLDMTGIRRLLPEHTLAQRWHDMEVGLAFKLDPRPMWPWVQLVGIGFTMDRDLQLIRLAYRNKLSLHQLVHLLRHVNFIKKKFTFII